MADGHSDVFHHVRDAHAFEVPQILGGRWEIPQIFGEFFPITKFMVLEVVAAVIVFVIFRGVVKRMGSGEAVRGRFWNFWETLAVFLRDEVVRPTIGEGHHGHDDHGDGHHPPHTPAEAMADTLVDEHADFASIGHHHQRKAGHPADVYLPFIWSIFFFVLICNLLGAIPWMGSPTGSLWATGALALFAFGATLFSGMKQLGVGGFWKALVPGMDLPPVMKILLVPMIWGIEFVGLIIKHGVLAVRLFANIMAGHTVIAVMLSFIGAVGGSWLFYVVTPASVLGQVGIGLLELFVAFLQAYIFAFLATLFIGTAVHPH